MSHSARGPHSRPGSIVVGVMRLARGHPDGVLQFGATRDAFLTSLAPLIAFPLVGGVLAVLSGDGLDALSDLLGALCALLAPPVISFELARLWGKEPAWLRFATAFNWCQWAIPVVTTVLLLLASILAGLGVPQRLALIGGLVAVVAYSLWLHWFVVRHGLSLSSSRALLMVAAVNVGTLLAVWVPRWLAYHLSGQGLTGQ